MGNISLSVNLLNLDRGRLKKETETNHAQRPAGRILDHFPDQTCAQRRTYPLASLLRPSVSRNIELLV